MADLAREAARIAGAERAPHPCARRFVCAALRELPSLADRVVVVELLGSGFLPPPQFVDDLTAPCPSEGAVRGVLGDEPSAACNRYARRVKACINYAPGKSCVLPLLDAPAPVDTLCPVVGTRRLLGALVDAGLTFLPLLRECVARGHSLFDQLLAAALAGGFSIPVAAAQVHPRVESAILYPCPLLAGVPGAEAALNRLQGVWARKLLGCHQAPPPAP